MGNNTIESQHQLLLTLINDRKEALEINLEKLKNNLRTGTNFWENQEILTRKRCMEYMIYEFNEILKNIENYS